MSHTSVFKILKKSFLYSFYAHFRLAELTLVSELDTASPSIKYTQHNYLCNKKQENKNLCIFYCATFLKMEILLLLFCSNSKKRIF